MHLKEISIESRMQEQLVDVTGRVSELVSESGVRDGLCIVYTPHTTAAVTINENADPDVVQDILSGLSRIIPEDGFDHSEGNSPAHIKSSIIGASETLIIKDGKLRLGTWQGIYFCEFNGPRTRKVLVKVL